MEEYIKAYTAGFLDGEGYLGIHNTNHSSMRAKTGRPYHMITIHVVQKDKKILEWLKSQWGGGEISLHTSSGCWRWILYSRDVLELLRATLPYLKVKKKQAEIIIQFPFYKTSTKRKGLSRTMPNAMFKIRQKLYTQIRKLKGI